MGAEVRCAAVNSGGRGGGGETEARVGLFAATGGFVEDRAVDFGDDDIIATAEIECGVGAEREGV